MARKKELFHEIELIPGVKVRVQDVANVGCERETGITAQQRGWLVEGFRNQEAYYRSGSNASYWHGVGRGLRTYLVYNKAVEL